MSATPHASAPAEPRRTPDRVLNAFSVDVEDYFQVSAFEAAVPRSLWSSLEHRVERNTDRVLEILSDRDAPATFFVLGWVAERYPDLVRRIRGAGHEVALHGYDHRRIVSQSPGEFREDIRKSKQILEDLAGEPVIGYRAPSYSVVDATMWSLEILRAEGFRYDSSIFPIHHDRYGIPDAPRHPWIVLGAAEDTEQPLWEFPISTLRILGMNLPFVGGGYLRQFPMFYVRWGMRRLNQIEKRPAVVYIHPWEIDPEQPRLEVPPLTRLRHYRNLDKMEGRLQRLLDEFPFGTVREVLGL